MTTKARADVAASAADGGRRRDRRQPRATKVPGTEARAAKAATKAARAKAAKAKGGPVKPLLAGLVVLLLVLAGAMFSLQPAHPGRSLPLDAVLRAGIEKRVRTATFLDFDKRITGTLVEREGARPVRFYTAYPSSDAATDDIFRSLFAAGTRITVEGQPTKALVRFLAQFLLPLVILADLFALLFSLNRNAGGGTSEFLVFARIGEKRLGAGDRGRTTFADVAASEEALVELAEVRDCLADPKAFAAMGALPPKGVLLVGPPGCGKTLLARAVAGEADAAFFSISGSEFVESLVGVGAARVRDLFQQTRAAAPAILFIDELDGVGRQRGAGVGGGHDEREQTLNELLVQMDGFSPTAGLVVIAATNRPDILDPALLRPGRFDRQITVERPDREGRLEILRLHARSRRVADPDRDLPAIAAATPGFTGADLSNVLNEAALLAVREKAGSITRVQLDEAVERSLGGPRRKARLMAEEDRRRISVHEAGHAVVAAAMGKAGSFDKISIISRGRGIGHLALLADERLLPTKEDMEAQLAIAMAGVAAEQLVLGQPSIGSEMDLDRATTIARDMAGRYGMSDRLGRVRVLRNNHEVFLGRDYLLTKEVSQPTLEHLDVEVRRMLDEQEAIARSVLADHRAVFDSLAESLMTRETLKGDELRRALAGVQQVRRGNNGGTANGAARRPARARAAASRPRKAAD